MPALIALLVLALAGCTDPRPSSGRCTGTVAGAPVEWSIDPDASDFHRWDGLLGDEDGPFRMSYGSGALTIDAEFESLPQESYLGAHALPTDPIFHFFRVAHASASFDRGTMTLTTATRDRMAGDMTLTFTDGGELACTFDLRRNHALDTED